MTWHRHCRVSALRQFQTRLESLLAAQERSSPVSADASLENGHLRPRLSELFRQNSMVGVSLCCNLWIPVGCTHVAEALSGPRLQQNKRPTAATLGSHADQLQTGHCHSMLRLWQTEHHPEIAFSTAGYDGGSGDPRSRLNVGLVFHVLRKEAR